MNNSKQPRVLVIEDDPDGLRSIVDALECAGNNVTACSAGKDGVRLFEENEVDVVISDIRLPDFDGMDVLSRIRHLDPDVPVLLMTAYGTVSAAVAALKAGAYDYVLKPLDLDDIQAKTARAVETRLLRSQVSELKAELREQYPVRIIAKSGRMLQLLRQVKSVAGTNATVLIQGESGTGKELIARAIHMASTRADSVFAAVNCGALSESLLESELFGHEKGSFTGAVSNHRGAFERAEGGTLFLDEIGIASAPVQTRLLRVIEEREILRVGGSRVMPVDVRIISATNSDLEDLVAEGKFRRDLLYRLLVVTLNIPPLRERKEDIRPLANHFLATACSNHGRHIESVDPGYYEKLNRHDWPGNVRELANVIESSVIMAETPSLSSADLTLGGRADALLAEASELKLAEIEKRAILDALTHHRGSRTLAAEELGVSTRTIQRKVKEYNLPY